MGNDPREAINKALQLNLKPTIYGTIAEIGAGQEVARHFFRAGGAAGTIAKTMSAYDMTFSDAIYGEELSGRYVCESRLLKMLSKEFKLLRKRLEQPGTNTRYFAFADTVAARSYGDSGGECHGWLGVRFQAEPEGEPSDLIIHVRMLDAEAVPQQRAVGVVGVNMIHSCYLVPDRKHHLVPALMDGVTNANIEIDMIRTSGPAFADLDDRLLSLQLVRHGTARGVMFNAHGQVVQPSEMLYKRNILVLRGSFRPPTLVNEDVIRSATETFAKSEGVSADNTVVLAEIGMEKLETSGESQDGVNEIDFLARVDLLTALHRNVLISNYKEFHEFSHWFTRFKPPHLGIAIGAQLLRRYIREDFFAHLPGGILEAFGHLLSRNVELLVYPASDETAASLTIEGPLRHFYAYLLESGVLRDITGADKALTQTQSGEALALLQSKDPAWKKLVPPTVAEQISQRGLWGSE